MKAYGKPRKACANRKIKGTSTDCPCCTPRGSNSDESSKSYKAKERRLSNVMNTPENWLDVDRTHEECVECELVFLDPPKCEGHVSGPVSCKRFIQAARGSRISAVIS